MGPLQMEEGNGEVVDHVEAVEVLNKYFSPVFTLEELGNTSEHNPIFLDSAGKGFMEILFTKENMVEQLK